MTKGGAGLQACIRARYTTRVLRFSMILCFSAVLAGSYISSAQDASAEAKPLLKACSHKNHAPCIDKPPAVLQAPDPDYSVAARNAKIQGVVVLLITIGTDGLARDIRVARSLGYGLDELAVDAVKKWTFRPAKSAGKPVPAQVNIEVLFRYH